MAADHPDLAPHVRQPDGALGSGEADALLGVVFETAPIGLGYCDTDLRFVRVNARLAEINGLPVAAHLGKTPAELLPKLAGVDQIMEQWRGILRTGRPIIGVEISGETPAAPDVTRHWVESWYPVRRGDRIVGVAAVVEEVTEQRRAEAALRVSEERFRLAAEAINGLVYEWDFETGAVYRSAGLREVIGYGPEEAEPTADWWTELVHPDDYVGMAARWDENRRRRATSFDGEYRVRHRDGRWIWVREQGRVVWGPSGQPRRIVGTTWSIDRERRAADELVASEARYRELFEANPHPMWLYELASLRFLAVNDAAVSHYGYARDEFLAMTIADIRPPEDVPRLMSTVQALPPGLGAVGVWRHLKKDGTVIQVEITAHILTFEGRPAALVLAHDVTAQRQAEAALLEEQERLRLATAAARMGHFEIDWLARRRYWSRELREMLAVPDDLDIAADAGLVDRLLLPEHRERYRARVAASLDPSGSGEFEDEHEVVALDGARRWMLLRGKTFFEPGPAGPRAVRTLGLMMDITERKRAEEAVRDGAARLQLALDAAALGTFEYDASAEVVRWDGAAWATFGLDAGETSAETVLAMIHPDDRDRLRASVAQALDPAVAGAVPAGEYRVLHHDGTVRWVDVRLSTTVVGDGAEGSTVRVIGAVQDVSFRKEAEAERERLVAALREANRVKDETMAAVAHDLKSPLTAVQGYASLAIRRLQREAVPEDRTLVSLRHIERAAARMSAALNELVDVAQHRTGQPLQLRREPTDLAALVREVAGDHQQTAPHLRIVVAADEAVVGCWDRARLERVVHNLLSNAVRYSPNGDEVAVTLLAEAEPIGPCAVLRVADRGIGIPDEDVPRIFDRFHRGANVIGRLNGTGIGLASVRQIVEAHGGRVDVESREGVGSTFTVRLPLDTEACESGVERR